MSIAHAGISCTKERGANQKFREIFDGPFASRIPHHERKTPWPQIWETSGDKEYHPSNQLKKKCKVRQFLGIHDRFLLDQEFRVRMIENNRDEEVCRRWDVLADEDHTYSLSEKEYFYHRNKWWLHLNKSGSDNLPLRKRSDFKRCPSQNVYIKKQEKNHMCLLTLISTNNGSLHRVRPLHGGNGKTLGGLLNIQKVKEEASKVLRKNGETPLLTVLWRKPPKMAFKNSIYFVTDRSFTADSGLL